MYTYTCGDDGDVDDRAGAAGIIMFIVGSTEPRLFLFSISRSDILLES